MAVCNIFNPLSKPTGTFLTFSQYAESMANVSQKVIPSKFVVINIDNNLSNDLAPEILQNYYENGVAVIKNKMEDNQSVWKNEYSKDLFWRTMFDHFINNEDIKYIGDINIQSYEEYGGTGYTEIYCYIPNEAGHLKYENLTPSTAVKKIDERISGSAIEGYDDIKISNKIIYSVTDENNTNNEENFNPKWYDELKPYGKNNTSTNTYTFNAIVVLYDVIDVATKKPVQINQPMGIYFTGTFETVDGKTEMSNYVTKYVGGKNLNMQGTSYGLRICTKHITSNSSSKINEFQITHDTKSELGYALSQMSQSQSKMDEVIDHTYNCIQNYKDLAAIFKISKTNVPYIKTIDGKDYWFVNGRRVGTATIDNGEVGHVCGIEINLKIYDKNDEFKNEISAISIEELLKGKKILELEWELRDGDMLVSNNDIDEIIITNPAGNKTSTQPSIRNISTGIHEITLNKLSDNTKYNQSIEEYSFTVRLINGQTVTKKIGYVITFPSYIGLIKGDKVIWTNYLMSAPSTGSLNNKLSDLLNSKDLWCNEAPNKLVLKNQEYIYNYTNNGYKEQDSNEYPYHVCYIYPAINTVNTGINHNLSTVTAYRKLTTIKDSRDLEYINDFSIVGPELIDNNDYHPYIVGKFGNSFVLYNVYIDDIPSFVNNYTLTFK